MQNAVKCFVVGISVFLLTSLLLPSQDALSADWPTWRGDSRRSGATDEQLPAELVLSWSSEQTVPRPAWPEDPRLYFDASLEPIVVGKTLLLSSARNDSVTALHTENGKRRWRFYADAPIRFAPVASEGHVYFGADDGFFYCLQLSDGKLVWKFRAAPSTRKALGNERLTSVWPVRGGSVLADGKLYFTAGIWPFEGTQLYSLELTAGTPTPSRIMLPEKVTPQGYLVAENGKVLIPSGRDQAAIFDVANQTFVTASYKSRGKTDFHVTAQGNYLLHGDRLFDVADKKLLGSSIHRPVTTAESVYGTQGGKIVALDLAEPQLVKKTDRRGKTIQDKILKVRWEISSEQIATKTKEAADAPVSIEVKTANRLYGIHGQTLFAVDLPGEAGKEAAISWTLRVGGTPTRLIAADGRLFAATVEGQILSFGSETAESTAAAELAHAPAKPPIEKWLADVEDRGGYALVLGAQNSDAVEQILAHSEMHVLLVDNDPSKIDDIRRKYDARGLYGSRVAALASTLAAANLPPYTISLAVCDGQSATEDRSLVSQLYRCLRPYGGRVVFSELPESDRRPIARAITDPQVQFTGHGSFSTISRRGALPGAADWTHEYGDESNSLMSHDNLVKAPFGVLWFGGPAASSDLFFNRHYWPPSLTVNQGRMFFQGPEVFVAVDIYTGRVLWRKKLPKGISPGRRGNFFEKVRVGFHFLAAYDAVYLSDGSKCEMLDPATGEVQATFEFKNPDAKWGTMRLWEDRLICTVFLPDEQGKYHPEEIVSINRKTGAEVWRHKAQYSAPIAALGGRQVYFYDGILEGLYDAWKRRGKVPKSGEVGYLKALDINTGKQLWQSGTSRAVTWLGISPKNGVLVASNKTGIEGWDAESGQPLWEKEADGKGFLGHPEELWDKVILWNDRIIDQRGPGLAYDIKTGEPLTTDHPLTGEKIPWEFTKTGHHCNYAIASPHLLTFRADTAGFLDMESGVTGRLNGFRSGCRNSLIPAGGVLNAPNFAHGCVCSYSLFTSLALVHTPDADIWAYNAFEAPEKEITRVGVNLGAPGDREGKDGTLWLDFPNVGGPSPKVEVAVSGDKLQYFRQHSLSLQGEELPWVAASGCEGLSAIKIRCGEAESRRYKVTLVFAEQEESGPRSFDVSIQGQPVLSDFNIREEAGGNRRVVVRSFESAASDNTIEITFKPRQGLPLLCGLQLTRVDK